MNILSIKKYFLIALGSVALVLGIIGIFLPVLPTTPFLILAAFCYMRSSKRLYNWLINHRIFGAYIYNYMTYKAVTKSTKIGSLLFLWLSISISMLIISNIYVTLLLLFIGGGVSIHLLTLKTLRFEDMLRHNADDKANQKEKKNI